MEQFTICSILFFLYIFLFNITYFKNYLSFPFTRFKTKITLPLHQLERLPFLFLIRHLPYHLSTNQLFFLISKSWSPMKISATLCLSVLLCACFTVAIAQQSAEDWYAKGVSDSARPELCGSLQRPCCRPIWLRYGKRSRAGF